MKKLQEFAKWVLEQSFEGCDIAGDNAQKKAHELGLLKLETFNPDIYVERQNSEILEPGDDIYFYTDKLKRSCNICEYEKEIAELKAQVKLLIGELEYFVSDDFEFNEGSEHIIEDIDKVLDATPEQCLNQIKAKTIRHCIAKFSVNNFDAIGTSHIVSVNDLEAYATELEGK